MEQKQPTKENVPVDTAPLLEDVVERGVLKVIRNLTSGVVLVVLLGYGAKWGIDYIHTSLCHYSPTTSPRESVNGKVAEVGEQRSGAEVPQGGSDPHRTTILYNFGSSSSSDPLKEIPHWFAGGDFNGFGFQLELCYPETISLR
ncbi:MAG: hypothetical protein HY459_00020 [Parcubacteria group bacterium]|nr:hypothetical protein [Parcubacteria group bacterium]